MVSKVEEAVKRALADGSVIDSNWDGVVRTGELNNCVVGDVLQMPEKKYTIVKSNIRGTDVSFQSAYVENQNGETRRVFPSMFQRTAGVYKLENDVAIPTGEVVQASGTAADLFRKSIKVEDGMNSLLGKKLEIKKIEKVKTRAYGSTTQLREQNIYTIDIVE